MKYRYKNIACSQMTDEEIASCAGLFSEHYGTWSQSADEKMRGKNVKLSPAFFRKMYVEKPNRYVAMMFDREKLIGQVLYIRCASPWRSTGKITFVQQLVVDKNYRGRRFGLKMLQSIFGLSNDDAWGLYTSNPLTIRALEDATFRHISVEKIQNNLSSLKKVLYDVFDGTAWLDSFRNGCVDTNFNVGHEKNAEKIKKAYPNGGFPFKEELREGEEYLAVIFNSQPVDARTASLGMLTETSWEVINEAYSRMDMQSHKWARFAKEEVDALFEEGWVQAGCKILDLGCGIGRHAIELARRGCTVKGVDFSERLIEIARSVCQDVPNVSFDVADILKFKSEERYDVVLCLYDVVGSSIIEGADMKIANTIYRALRHNGRAIVSAMNLAMTQKYCRRLDNTFSDIKTKEDFSKLIKLPASQTMQLTGEIFKGQLLLLNPDSGIVYRKEQFVDGTGLPREYVIADKRYTGESLRKLFSKFECEDVRYVRAGRFAERLRRDERHAKEVLGVFRKVGRLNGFAKKVMSLVHR